MSKLKKIILIFLLAISLVLLLTSFSSAAEEEEKERPLEIEYPKIGGWQPKTVEQAVLPEYVKYIFNFSIAIAGLIAFGALVYGGFRYITSVGAPLAQTEAKDQIFAGIIGLIILLSSYLILTTINPQLVMLKLEPVIWPELPTDLPGVYLIYFNPDTGEDEVKAYTSSTSPLGLSRNAIMQQIKIVNPVGYDYKTGEKKQGEYYYGAILFPYTDYRGEPLAICRSIESRQAVVEDWTCQTPTERANSRSLFVFREVEKTDGEVTLCTEIEGKGECRSFREQIPLWTSFSDKKCKDSDGKNCGVLNQSVWSATIEGNYLLILKGVVEGNWYNRSMVYLESFEGPHEWSNFTNYTINQCGYFSWKFFSYYQTSCATQFAIIPIKGD